MSARFILAMCLFALVLVFISWASPEDPEGMRIGEEQLFDAVAHEQRQRAEDQRADFERTMKENAGGRR
jgi:hypothetical protein